MQRPITVVELPGYLGRAERLLSEAERDEVVTVVATDPERGVLIRGTGGVRKLRFGRADRGKSGGVRVIYYFVDETIPVFLLTVFAKGEKADLTAAERNALAKLVPVLRASYGR